MMDRYIDVRKLKEEILTLPHFIPVVEPDNAKEEKYENLVDTAGNGIESQIGFVDILTLREEVVSPPLSIPEPSETKEVETVDNVCALSQKQVEATTHRPPWKTLTRQTIVTFGKIHRRRTMTLIEEAFLTWTVVTFTPLAKIAHRKARDRWKMGQSYHFEHSRKLLYLIIFA